MKTRATDRTSREQVERWAEGRGLTPQSLGSWLGSNQSGGKAGASLGRHLFECGTMS